MKLLYISVFLLALFIRVYNLVGSPPSLYWEEAALGYDAYSILLTGKDHHGNPFPVVAFESFGDWKPSGYFYILVPFIALFGLSELAVRLPTVLAGLALIIGVSCIARQLKISPLIVLFVGAVSPWAIQFSRAGWEVTTATACIVWGNYLFLKGLENKNINLRPTLFGVLLFAVAMYTYHATRLIVPLQLVGLVVLYLYQQLSNSRLDLPKLAKSIVKVLQQNFKQVLSLLLVFLILTSPLLAALGSTTTSHRFQETSIFSDLEIIERSNMLKDQSGNTALARLFYHRYVLFAAEIAQNFFSHFSLKFLFLTGDSNPRHSIQFYGQLYHVEIIFLLVGLYLWMKQRKPVQLYFFYWLFVAIIPASLTNATPHALRILPGLPVFLLLIGLGIETTFLKLKQLIARLFRDANLTKYQSLISLKAAALIVCVYLIEFLGFWRYYQVIYPQLASSEWQYGYKEMIHSIANLEREDPEIPIYITREFGRPAMYYWFYTMTDPRDVQAQNARMPKDQGEFLQYKNIYFIDKVDQIAEPGIVASSTKFYTQIKTGRTIEEVSEISDLQNNSVWKIYKIK